jgi:hypothetical protein
VVQFLWGLAGGVVAWITTTVIAQPLLLFWSLRTEAARVISLYERRGVVIPGLDDNRVRTRKLAYEACGSHLVAFDATYGPIIRLITFRRFPFAMLPAGEALIAASTAPEGSAAAAQLRESVVRALRLPSGL